MLNLIKNFFSGWNITFQGGIDIIGVIHELELQKGGSTDQVLRTIRIFNSGQLDQNAVFTLPSNIGFGYPKLVDTIADRFQSLINSQLFDFFGFLDGHLQDDG